MQWNNMFPVSENRRPSAFKNCHDALLWRVLRETANHNNHSLAKWNPPVPPLFMDLVDGPNGQLGQQTCVEW